MDREKNNVDERSPLQPKGDDGGSSNGSSTKVASDLFSSNGIESFYQNLKATFGLKFLLMLTVGQHLIMGIVDTFDRAARQYVFQEYVVSAPQANLYKGVIKLPWALQPALGVMSDLFPISGYNKGPYLALAGTIGTISLGTLGQYQGRLTLTHVVMLLTCVSLFLSMVALLTEAAYASVLRQNPKQGPNTVSFVWAGNEIWTLFASIASGMMLSEEGLTKQHWLLYLMASVPAAMIIFPAAFNWLGEKQLSAAEIKARRESILSQFEVMFLCSIMLLATLILLYTGMTLGPNGNAIASLVVLVTVSISFMLLLNPIIAKVNTFALLQMSLYISIGSADFYFSTDTQDKYPAGPHFSRRFYNLVLPTIASVFSFVGIMLYQRYSSRVRYTTMAIVGNAVVAGLSLLDTCFYARLNKRWGVDDHVMVLGLSAFEYTIGYWLWMPVVVIMAQLCTPGIEAIMYAILAGCHHLGDTISYNFGAFVLNLYGIDPHGNDGAGKDTNSFENLWIASLIGAASPLISILLVPWMIPDIRQVDPIFPREDMPATEGSWYRTRFHRNVALGV